MPDSTPAFAPLATERFVLRPLRAEDAAELHRLVNDWEVAKTLARVPFPYPRQLADEWIASTLEQIAEGTAYHLAIAQPEAEGGAMLGCVGLTIEREERSAELGYWVARRHWGQGIAPEAAGRLARWAIANLNIDRITASALTDNARSAAVLRRIGFRDAGKGQRDFLSRGGGMPVLLFEAGRADLAPPVAPPAPAPEAALAGGKPILLVAAVGLIDPDNRVLLARRPEGKPLAGLWEFPGGKVRAGETPEVALIRELKEELGIDVTEACLAPFAFASHGYEAFHLLMPLFLCRRWQGQVTALEGQALAWVRPQRLADYAMPPADVPLVALLRDFL
ncbi:bifunctional GNAT family N-acetyltransferase/(deoxy)nucleoside triphosphate pyrophosphohydrolase [Neoroseomonas oryzicola]|uniref:8-oxo-dGTP diphosphatase n=1 Tax=Neoroseomonas oryzicola TaxID=535904 RepID=A0A9X9WMT5_9PROT|nr:bifunctional GNAT family N-acetyltransferase/(deoxy)nucleoside triphosphate pyrophosphohydrolase [Neoroseomonas oryzicola]MBR0661645.1 GNAT family N-acetyltransferase [Neoroseomonas oryzicola]NKE16892.1 GNAT family N-acetyltransferase [Neoroseomonas oryzicola]